jgi:hypothetical protein
VSPKRRRRPATGRRSTGQCRGGHGRPEPLAIASVRVIHGAEPLRLVLRYADGGWAFLCNTTADVDDLMAVHSHHLFDEFPGDLRSLRFLPPRHLAVRDEPGRPWRIEPYDEEQ